jgi:carboxyl-terminal processing protease
MYENNNDENFEQMEQAEQIDWANVQIPKKESFFKRHGFVLGFLTSLFCVVLVAVLAMGYLKASGNIWVVGESGVSKVKGNPILTQEIVDKIEELYSYMNIYYYEDVDRDTIDEALYSGLLESLNDRYSVYYTEEEYEELMVSTSGTYCGIGAGVSQNLTTMEVTITKVYKGTPAEEAGLLSGDMIIAVGDLEATTVSVDELVQDIRGEEGTTVHITVYRPSTEETLEFDVMRRFVELSSVEGEMLDNGIAYIEITEFQSKTDEQFQAMIEEFKAQGMKGLIVDVRSNPGGLLTSVVNMLDYVLPEGLLVYVEDKYGNRDEYRSNAACLEIPMVVLTNENSASASEIFAGALKDYGYATLVGKTTYGKGIVQNVIPLEDGDAIKLTTAKYFTPNGNYIHGVGVSPDVEVEYEYSGDTSVPYDRQYDSQFVKALEEIQKLLK